jgi:hypothetical protein
MKLYVCWGTFKVAPRPGGHPCGRAYHALKDAGYEPDVTRCYGWAVLPKALNDTPGRKEVERLTGQRWVPVLVTDDEQIVTGSYEIEAWAKAHPAGAAEPTATPAG